MEPNRVRPHGAVAHEVLGDETVIVNLVTGSYYSTDGVGAAIWAMVALGATRADIVRCMCAEYSGDPEEIGSVTSCFLDELVGESLTVEDAEPLPAPQILLKPRQGGDFVAPRLQKYSDMEELLQLDPVHEVDELGWPRAKAPAM